MTIKLIQQILSAALTALLVFPAHLMARGLTSGSGMNTGNSGSSLGTSLDKVSPGSGTPKFGSGDGLSVGSAKPFTFPSTWSPSPTTPEPTINKPATKPQPTNPEDTVLGTVSKGESPVYACNARLKDEDPERYGKMSDDIGLYLPTVKPPSSFNPDLKQVTPPVMKGVTQCQSAKKNGCMKLLGYSLSNPAQLSYNSTCSGKTVTDYEDLINPAPTQERDEDLEEYKERDEALRDIYNEHSTCENQAEMVMDIIGALDGNPTSKLANVDSGVLMGMLKEVSPSVHHAVECLIDNNGNATTTLGGTGGVNGEIIGTLTGILYDEGFKKSGSKLTAYSAAITATAAIWVAYETRQSRNAADRSAVTGEKAVEESKQAREQAFQQWKWEQGISSSIGTKPGCDGAGRCNKSADPISGTPSSSNPNPTQPAPAGPKPAAPTNTTTTPGTSPSAGNTDPFDIPDLPTKPQPGDVKYSPDVDTNAPVKIGKDNNGHHYKEGAADEICEKVYAGQSSLNSKLTRTASRTTWSQEQLEEEYQAKEPIDYTNDAELHGMPAASCSVATYGEGL